jgi:hypothetical protein
MHIKKKQYKVSLKSSKRPLHMFRFSKNLHQGVKVVNCIAYALIEERMDVFWKVQFCDPLMMGFLKTETYVGAF